MEFLDRLLYPLPQTIRKLLFGRPRRKLRRYWVVHTDIQAPGSVERSRHSTRFFSKACWYARRQARRSRLYAVFDVVDENDRVLASYRGRRP
jgi:hypothetical protein